MNKEINWPLIYILLGNVFYRLDTLGVRELGVEVFHGIWRKGMTWNCMRFLGLKE